MRRAFSLLLFLTVVLAGSVCRAEDEILELLTEDNEIVYTPTYGSPSEGTDSAMSYWTLPMDITDTEAVWEMLMQPVTVLDSGRKSNGAKVQIAIRSEPDKEADAIGVVTCITQSVHVLERGETWSKIECYSSSFHSTKAKAYNMLVQGWVQTKYLKTVTPYQGMGLVVDKLTQRLYIFVDGELYDTLLVSTGLANAKQPYNETRSGEFLLQVPAVGDFKSDNLICSMGIRFNAGDLLHEVPHTVTKKGKNYANESKLGTKASHGCIRVQRKKTAKGTNMKWIWDNKHNNMKIVIWEDWQGRTYPRPDSSMALYSDGAGVYHTSDQCPAVSKGITSGFTYADLEDAANASLTRCDSCAAPLRSAEIDAIDATYAVGGDHNPVMSAVQRKCADTLGLKGYYNPD